MGASLCNLLVPSSFGARDKSEVTTGCIFSWVALEVSILVWHKAGVVWARSGIRCEPALLPGSMDTPTLMRGGTRIQEAGEGALRELRFSPV